MNGHNKGNRPSRLCAILTLLALLVLTTAACTPATSASTASPAAADTQQQVTTTLVLQQGTSPNAAYSGTTDVIITNLWQANTQLGGWQALDTYRDGQERHRMLIRFDLSPLPSGAQVQSATLSLYHFDSEYDDAAQTVSAFRLTAPWTEGTGVEFAPDPAYVPDGATYSLAAPGTVWAAAGGDFDPSAVDSTVVPAFSAPGWIDWDLTALVGQWAGGSTPNHGVILRTGDGDYFGHRFYSRNYADDPALRPRLTIVYTTSNGSSATYLPLTVKQSPTQVEPTPTNTATPGGPTATSTPTPTPTPTPQETETPAAQKIVFNRGLDLAQVIGSIQVSAGSSIWTVDPNDPAGTLARVIPNEVAGSLMPSWGPGQTRIVFASNREKAGDTPLLDIWTVKADGGNLQQLTQNTGHNWTPAWSPDGNSIAFASTRNAPGGDFDTVTYLDIYIMDADGANQRLLADLGAQDEDPVFSADSQTVYFVAEQPACFQLWQVPAAGGSAQPLLDNQSNPICGEDPSLSPDGDTLFFWANLMGQFAGLNLTTGEVTGYAWGSLEPWIGPNGDQFTYMQDGNVYVANLDGSGATMVTQIGDDFLPRWAAPAGSP